MDLRFPFKQKSAGIQSAIFSAVSKKDPVARAQTVQTCSGMDQTNHEKILGFDRSIAFAQNIPTVNPEEVGVVLERPPARIRVMKQIADQQPPHLAFAVMNWPGVIDDPACRFPADNHGVEGGVV